MTKMTNLTPVQRTQVEKLRAMSDADWESLCKRCGMCCMNKIDMMGLPMYTYTCCEHLDTETKCCKIYKRRNVIKKAKCKQFTIDVILDESWLPRTCGYVEFVFGPAPREIHIDWTRVKKQDITNPRTPLTDRNDIIFNSLYWNQR